MERKIVIKEDSSHTIEIKDLNTNYHSVHGAIQESLHVFIHEGFEYFLLENNNKPASDES